MKLCQLRTGYLDRTLDREELRVFESHLRGCKHCRDKTNEWRHFEGALKSIEQSRHITPVTIKDATELMFQAERPPNLFLRPLTLVTAPLAAAAFLLAVFLWTHEFLFSSGEVDSVPVRIELVSSHNTEVIAADRLRDPIVAPVGGALVASIDADRVGMAPNAEMRIIRASERVVRIRLERGTVACSVSPRRGNGRFMVEAGDYMVSVLGTKFKVTKTPATPLEVTVERGTVRVENAKGVSWFLNKGDIFAVDQSGRVVPDRAEPLALAATMNRLLRPAFEAGPRRPDPGEPRESVNAAQGSADGPRAVAGATLSESTAPTTPAAAEPERPTSRTVQTVARTSRPTVTPSSRVHKAVSINAPEKKAPTGELPTWRQWILDGRMADARVAMKRYLKSAPADGKAWALLADCERKERNWYSAVTAYEKVIEHGSAKQASHAKYMAATIYQERLNDHRQALKMFKEYRRSGFVQGELRDLTDVKMARSLIAVGDCAEATQVLGAVIENQGNSFVAANAKKLIKKCDRPR